MRRGTGLWALVRRSRRPRCSSFNRSYAMRARIAPNSRAMRYWRCFERCEKHTRAALSMETESQRAARLGPEPKRPRGHAQVKSLNQGSPGNRGKGNGVKVSNGSSQSARKNTATVRAEPIASSTISSLSRSRLMQRQRSEQRATASQPEPCGSMCCVLINPQARNGGYCGTPSTPMMRNFACLLPIVLTSL